jgi:hypothetical protein
MKNESGLEFYISNAGVESDRNYTCIPFNSVSYKWIRIIFLNFLLKITKLQKYRSMCFSNSIKFVLPGSNL